MRNRVLCCALIVITSCGQVSQGTNSVVNSKDSISHATSITSVKDSFDNLKRALQNQGKVIFLHLSPDSDEGYETRHLPSQLGTFSNLKVLQIDCFSNLEDLPSEIGNLKTLEELIMDQGNGCQMNVQIPASIGQLTNLKVLWLYGSLDWRGNPDKKADTLNIKKLPSTIANLQNLEELSIGRNGLTTIPMEIWSLKKLKKLDLSYNDFREVPAAISDLENLKELDVSNNSRIKLPESIKEMKGLKILIGGNGLKYNEQRNLTKEFPNITFSFESEYGFDSVYVDSTHLRK